MGFISKQFDMKMLARKLHRKQPLPEYLAKTDANRQETIGDLDDYLFQQLFLPIVRYGSVPIASLDIVRISHEDINLLAEALDNCAALDLFQLGDAFTALPPAASPKSMFI